MKLYKNYTYGLLSELR